MTDLTDLPEHMRTREWIESEIRYQEHQGVHTYCPCRTCGESSRGGRCADCWREYLELLEESDG